MAALSRTLTHCGALRRAPGDVGPQACTASRCPAAHQILEKEGLVCGRQVWARVQPAPPCPSPPSPLRPASPRMMRVASVVGRRFAGPGVTRCLAAEAAAAPAGDGLAKTALYARHVELGGKMVPFAGYSMPVQYDGEGIKDSHLWVRANAGLFDISHMGEREPPPPRPPCDRRRSASVATNARLSSPSQSLCMARTGPHTSSASSSETLRRWARTSLSCRC